MHDPNTAAMYFLGSSMLFVVVWPFIGWLGCTLFSAYLAVEKGRWGLAWFFLGIVFGPVALVAIAGLPPRVQPVEEVSPRARPNRGEEPRLV
ncbi:hypothetical protein [Bordetella petrii]|uniref:hypothetical protein n=1 Tax=Bordetella petrii TaxID=94624 RepID=UPI000576FEB7|nr:hypothetical protein [Bordetella petrii]